MWTKARFAFHVIFQNKFPVDIINCLSESTAKLMLKSLMVISSLGGVGIHLCFWIPQRHKKQRGEHISASPPRNIGNSSNPNTTCRYPSLSPLCSKASKIMEQNHAMARCNKEGKNMQKWRLGKSFLDIPFPLGDFVWFFVRFYFWVCTLLCLSPGRECHNVCFWYFSLNAHWIYWMDVAKASWWNSNIFTFTVWGRCVGLKPPISWRF